MHKVSHERDPNCIVCCPGVHMEMKCEDTLQMLILNIISDKRFGLNVTNPSVSYQSTNLYMTGVLEGETKGNLKLSLAELLKADDAVNRFMLTVNDKSLPNPKRLWLSLQQNLDDRMEDNIANE